MIPEAPDGTRPVPTDDARRSATLDGVRDPADVPGRSRTRRPVSRRGMLWRSAAGVALEYYEFTVFATFAPFFAGQFFVSGDSSTAVLSALAVFAIGFAIRPVGGILIGWFADRVGRKPSLIVAMLASATGSLVVGLTPTYASVGVAAAVILTCARLLQGLGHGAESASAYVYMAEIAKPQRRGFYSSIEPVALILGVISATLLGALLTTILSTEEMNAWGWRIPFLLGGAAAVFALWLRRDLDEPEPFKQARKAPAAESGPATTENTSTALWKQRRNMIRVFFLISGVTVSFYTWGVGATSHAISAKGADPSVALWVGLAAQIVFLISLPLWGRFSDRFARRRLNYMIASLALIVLAFPLEAMTGPSAWQIFVPNAVALACLGAAMAVNVAYYCELFPTAIRARCIGIPLSLSTALFGGTAPYLNAWLVDRGAGWLFLVYTMLLCLATFIASATGPEVAGRSFTAAGQR